MSSIELRNQIAKCRRLARCTDAETARRLLELAEEYEAQVAQTTPAAQQTSDIRSLTIAMNRSDN